MGSMVLLTLLALLLVIWLGDYHFCDAISLNKTIENERQKCARQLGGTNSPSYGRERCYRYTDSPILLYDKEMQDLQSSCSIW
jgi:hypothetical protein